MKNLYLFSVAALFGVALWSCNGGAEKPEGAEELTNQLAEDVNAEEETPPPAPAKAAYYFSRNPSKLIANAPARVKKR